MVPKELKEHRVTKDILELKVPFKATRVVLELRDQQEMEERPVKSEVLKVHKGQRVLRGLKVHNQLFRDIRVPQDLKVLKVL